MPRNDTATAPPERTIVDVYENIGAGGSSLIMRRGAWNLANFAPRATFLNLNTGAFAIALITGGAFQGFYWYECRSAAASFRTKYQRDFLPQVPGDQSQAPAVGRYPVRWIMEAVLQRDGPLVADTSYSMQVAAVGTQFNEAPFPSGWGIYSNTTLNGGRWTAWSRVVTGGVAGPTFDLGVAGAGQVFCRLIYEETSNPLIAVELNGVRTVIAQGVANMPTHLGTQDWFCQINQGQSVGGGVGQIDRYRQPRGKLEELAGYSA